MRYYKWKGEQYSIMELSKLKNIDYHILYTRLSKGWPLDAALLIPPRAKRKQKKR